MLLYTIGIFADHAFHSKHKQHSRICRALRRYGKARIEALVWREKEQDIHFECRSIILSTESRCR